MNTPNALYPIRLTVNGEIYDISVPAYRTLVDTLRYDLKLTGTKQTCGIGVCGACSVLIDGKLLASCIKLAVQVDGAEITTIEGIENGGILHPLQQSFIDNGGFQCGICTSGQIIAAKALLDANPSPTREEIIDWMMGNLCRCTGYYQILDSISKVIETQKKTGPL